MHVVRVRVAGFGPLEALELELAPGLNVVYGRNEAGKTTLLDYLVSHLFRWEQRTGTRLETVLGDLDRFGDAGGAAGEIELRMGGELHAYPGEGPSLLHHLGLEHAGLAGLFCVRSGEMELPEKEPGDFWRELKKVLSGLPEGVESLRRSAHEAAGLTATGRISDRGDPGRRTRLRELEERVATLSELAGRLDRVAEIAEEVSRLERRQEALEAARRARIARLHDRLREARDELEELDELPEGAVERWRELERERERRRKEVGEARKALEAATAEAREAEEALEEREATAGELRERLEAVEEAELEARARRLEGTGRPGAVLRLAEPAYWVGLVLLVLGLGGAFFTPTEALWNSTLIVILGLALAAGAALHWTGRSLRERRDAAEAGRRSLLEEAAALGLEADDPEGVPAAVRRLESRTHRAERERDVARVRAENARERTEERREALEAAESALEEAAAGLEEVRETTGAGELAEAEALHERRERLRDRARELETSLQELAGMDEASWDVEPPGEAEDLPEWSAAEKRRVDRELEELREDHRELRRAFDRAGLREPEQVLVERREAEEKIREIERDREAGRLAGEIFATMGEALDERLAAALAREGPGSVGRLVHRVTESYVGVERDGDVLTVHDEEGRSWALPHLSRGTRDQVYLALRVGLARAALEAADLEEAGFFLLDDAFLTADWQRRERLVGAAAGLAEEGWQVVYLTCDDHLRDLFETAGARVHRL